MNRRDWEQEFQKLHVQEREAFGAHRKAQFRVIRENFGDAGVHESDIAADAWDKAKKTMDEFIEEFRRSKSG